MLYKVTSMGESALVTEGKYCLQYIIGKVTCAIFETFGIFCFNDFEVVREFTTFCLIFNSFIDIFEVEGIGEKIISNRIAKFTDEEYLDSFYKKQSDNNSTNILPFGMVCYESVKPLKKVWSSI